MSLDTATVATTVTMNSPIGELELAARAGSICEIRLVGPAKPDRDPAHNPAPTRLPRDPDPAHKPAPTGPADGVLAEAQRQLAEYFAGRRQAFELPTAVAGTPFQVSVWRALAGIGYGQTTTYSELARSIGKPHAARAVGAACGRNPLPLVVPCHRVIGAGGELRGFGLGGLAIKRWLLDAEAAQVRRSAAAAHVRSSAAAATGPGS